MPKRTLAELAELLGGTVVGDPSTEIHGVAGIREASPGDITFLANTRYEPHLLETRASAVICSRETREAPMPLLHVDNPYLGFQRVVREFRPDPVRPEPGVHATAVVASDATLGAGVSIGPGCVVGAGARIGANVILMAGCAVGPGSVVGDDTLLYPNVTVREECTIGSRCIFHPGVVIGSDGFGFALDGGRYHKVPQVGTVEIGDDVEIGANTTIDRATTDATRIGDGTKIDNLVQIGHNVQIGKHCIIVSQVGIAGSTRLEDYVTIAGQSGLNGHITIGQGAVISGKAGVLRSVPAGAVVSGYPAMSHGLFKRVQAMIQRLPSLFQRTKDLERRVEQLEHSREREQEQVP
jgi:UDP-3-O-[3-hydroxymyristoyl] glucosamine N-acyltransferase